MTLSRWKFDISVLQSMSAIGVLLLISGRWVRSAVARVVRKSCISFAVEANAKSTPEIAWRASALSTFFLASSMLIR